jgi:hypothetical protein
MVDWATPQMRGSALFTLPMTAAFLCKMSEGCSDSLALFKGSGQGSANYILLSKTGVSDLILILQNGVKGTIIRKVGWNGRVSAMCRWGLGFWSSDGKL